MPWESNQSQAETNAFINERLAAIEDQIKDLKSYVSGQDRPNNADGVKVIKLSDEELATIRSTLQSNSAIAASASAMAGRKILILVDPPGVCFDYSNF